MRRIVIVGGSLAGLRAAETLRAEGYDGQLTIIGDEPHPPYDRPPLSKEVLNGSMDAAAIALRQDDELGAEWLLGSAAVQLDVSRRTIRTAAGEEVGYDGLVIATGSVPRRLPGVEPDGASVVELRTMQDAFVLRDRLRERPRLVLVGCGFIGVEVASAARALGAEVAIVSLDPPLLVAGELVSEVAEGLLTDAGVRLHIGRRIAQLYGAGGVESVELDDGTVVPADLVVVAVGGAPATDWLAGSGLVVDNGVVCDGSLAAVGATGIVAAGDVARWPNPRFRGMPMRVEHWSNAVEQGMAAARTLLRGSSEETAFASVPSFWSDHFGTRLQSVGLPALADRVEVVAGSLAERQFVAAAWSGDELVGATTYGMARALAPYRIKLAKRELVPVHG